MRTLAALALLVALTVTPAADAAWLSNDPVEVTLAPSRVGDVLRYDVVSPQYFWDQESGERVVVNRSTLLVRAEGVGPVSDRYGLMREAATLRVEHLNEDGATYAGMLCHALAGGNQTVRRDFLFGMTADFEGESWTGLAGIELYRERERTAFEAGSLFFPYPCEGLNLLGGRTLREGDRLPFAALAYGENGNLSAPAVATEFHGRPALRFDFTEREMGEGFSGVFSFTVADGLPGVVNRTLLVPDHPHPAGRFGSMGLAGITPGDGAALPADEGLTLPERDPRLQPVAWRRLSVLDEELGLGFPFQEALAALRAQPGQASRWLAAHPDAHVEFAWYEASMRATGGTETDGGWFVGFRDGDVVYQTMVSRTSGVSTPAGPVPLPVKPATSYDALGMSAEREADGPMPAFATTASPADVKRALAAAGFAPGGVQSYGYWTHGWGEGGISISAEDQPFEARKNATQTRQVQADGLRGGLTAVMEFRTERESSGLLSPAQAGGIASARGDDRLSALGMLAGPGVGAGLPAGAAAGVTLLVVLVKFLLVPLFTRLRRDRLLDNPVRARLYERIRAEAGIHRAELVDFTGIGEGATRHHLQQLVAHRLVVEMEDGGFARYYAAGEVPPDVARQAAALRAQTRRAVYDLYAREPALSLREAARRLGVSAPSVHRAKKRLEREGLLPAAPVVEVRA